MNTETRESLPSRVLGKIENVIVTASLGIMILVVFLQIVFRYLSAMHIAGLDSFFALMRDIAMFILPWSEEVARYAMIWAVFIGAGMGARVGVHVGVDALVRIFPRGLKLAAVVLGGLCCMAFCLSLTWLGYEMVEMMMELGQVSPALEMPMYWAYLAVPVGGLLTALRFLQAMVEKVGVIRAEQEVTA